MEERLSNMDSQLVTVEFEHTLTMSCDRSLSVILSRSCGIRASSLVSSRRSTCVQSLQRVSTSQTSRGFAHELVHAQGSGERARMVCDFLRVKHTRLLPVIVQKVNAAATSIGNENPEEDRRRSKDNELKRERNGSAEHSTLERQQVQQVLTCPG